MMLWDHIGRNELSLVGTWKGSQVKRYLSWTQKGEPKSARQRAGGGQARKQHMQNPKATQRGIF